MLKQEELSASRQANYRESMDAACRGCKILKHPFKSTSREAEILLRLNCFEKLALSVKFFLFSRVSGHIWGSVSQLRQEKKWVISLANWPEEMMLTASPSRSSH